MFSVKYDIVEETYRCDGAVRTSYGIAAYDAQSGVTEVLAAIHDISVNEQEICTLVEKCNELNLYLEHLEDVVNDFLSE